MTYILEGVVERGTATSIKALERPVAGKTGTTNEQRDAWFIGYTPNLAVGVWVGFDDPNQTMGKMGTGGHVAAPIWLDFMKPALAGTPVRDFEIPEDISCVNIDPGSGRRAAEWTPSPSSSASRPAPSRRWRRGARPDEASGHRAACDVAAGHRTRAIGHRAPARRGKSHEGAARRQRSALAAERNPDDPGGSPAAPPVPGAPRRRCVPSRPRPPRACKAPSGADRKGTEVRLYRDSTAIAAPRATPRPGPSPPPARVGSWARAPSGLHRRHRVPTPARQIVSQYGDRASRLRRAHGVSSP